MKRQERDEDILTYIEDFVKRLVKKVVEGIMREEREIYLEQHEGDKGNGSYTRALGTKFGTIEEIKVPRVRKGGFRPSLLPYYRGDLRDTTLSSI